MTGSRAIYTKVPYLRRIAGRLGFTGMSAIAIGTWILIANVPIIREALRNGNLEERRVEWVNEKVKNLTNPDFSFLDDEEPPKPATPRVQIGQFREEFMKKYTPGI